MIDKKPKVMVPLAIKENNLKYLTNYFVICFELIKQLYSWYLYNLESDDFMEKLKTNIFNFPSKV